MCKKQIRKHACDEQQACLIDLVVVRHSLRWGCWSLDKCFPCFFFLLLVLCSPRLLSQTNTTTTTTTTTTTNTITNTTTTTTTAASLTSTSVAPHTQIFRSGDRRFRSSRLLSSPHTQTFRSRDSSAVGLSLGADIEFGNVGTAAFHEFRLRRAEAAAAAFVAYFLTLQVVKWEMSAAVPGSPKLHILYHCAREMRGLSCPCNLYKHCLGFPVLIPCFFHVQHFHVIRTSKGGATPTNGDLFQNTTISKHKKKNESLRKSSPTSIP